MATRQNDPHGSLEPRAAATALADAVTIAKAALESHRANPDDVSSLALVIRACLQTIRLKTELRSWTEDGFLLRLSAHQRQDLEIVSNELPSLVAKEAAGRAASLSAGLKDWQERFGGWTSPRIPEESSEADRATAYALISNITGNLYDTASFLEELRAACVPSVSSADWPIEPNPETLRQSAGLFAALTDHLCDDRGISFSQHEVNRANAQDQGDDYELPLSMTQARREVRPDPWAHQSLMASLFLEEIPILKPEAKAWHWLTTFGYDRIDGFIDMNPDREDISNPWERHRDQILSHLDRESFWQVVTNAFFKPDDWVLRSRELNPIYSHVLQLHRLQLNREIEELHQCFIFGNFVAAISLSRLILEQVLKDQLVLDSADRTDLETIVNRWCRQFRAPEEVKQAAHKIRNAGNRRLHRSRLEATDFAEAKLKAEALNCISRLRQILAFVDSGGKAPPGG
jgi:hypothetical protein